jgi:hypothetical protein
MPQLPEWPYRGGFLRQPAILAEAVSLLREEWVYVPRRKREKPKDEKPKQRRGVRA